MADRLEGANQLNEILFQDPIDSFPHRDNYRKITDVIASHAASIEALSTAASGSEVVDARDDEVDLGTAMRRADEIVGDALIEGVLNDGLIRQSAVPDDKADVDTFQAIINGKKVKSSSVQIIDPANFSGVSKERIDVVQVGNSGTVGITTGLEVVLGSGLAVAERPPDNTVVLAVLFLRSGAANPSPFAPEDIRNADNITESFIVGNRERFFVQRDRTDAERHPSNLIANGAMISLDTAGALSNWTATRGTLLRDTGAFIYGNTSGKFTGDGFTGGNFIEQELQAPESLRGKFITVSAFMKLDTLPSRTARITIRQEGDTPESDFTESFVINKEIFQRGHITGFIDNSVTAVFVRLELDTVDSSSVVGFFDGVQVSVGSILTDFEYPERIRKFDDGGIDFPSGDVKGDLTFVVGTTTTFSGTVNFTSTSDTNFESGSQINHESGSLENHKSGSTDTYEASSLLVLDGEVKGDGHFDTEVSLLAWVGI